MFRELFKERRVRRTVHGLGTKVHDEAPIRCGLNTVTATTPWLHRHADVSHDVSFVSAAALRPPRQQLES